MASWFSNLFGRLGGGESAEAGPPVEYKGFTIRPAPQRQGSAWLTAGVIAKPFGEQVKEHRFIRADTHTSREAADSFAVMKGKQIIDELGDRVFKDD
jgi:hypothetical protein